MIIPLSHEDQRGRRWPFVTIAILLLNILIFVFTNATIEEQYGKAQLKAEEAIEFYLAHPWLKPPPVVEKRLAAIQQRSRKTNLEVEAMKAVTEAAADTTGGVDDATKAEQQAELDKLAAELVEAEKSNPLKTYAYVPADNNVLGLFTSQFLHGGWMHLIFNMWFLYLAGCNIEDKWGRLWFPIFYLSAGAVAALTHKAAAPQSMIPLIGASGAIAGAMGAFLMKFAKTKITFLWLFALRVKVFDAPAYLMLPLWLISQIFYGMMYAGSEAGVAWWAHAGGFVFGVVFAIAFARTGLEAKVDQAIEGQVSLHQETEIVQAGTLIDEGRAPEAIEMLENFARTNPTSVDAQLVLLRAAQSAMDRDREKRGYTRLIGLYMQQNAPETALQIYEEMRQAKMDTAVPPALRMRLARLMEKENNLERAAAEFANIYGNGAADKTAFQALLAHANLMLRLKRKPEALQLFSMAQNSPVPHLDWDANIAHGLKQAAALPD